jgi:hypothetical protein
VHAGSHRSFRLEIFLVSLAAILLEISHTRIFSFEPFDRLSYLVIGIALLGIGAAGGLVPMVPRLRQAKPERVVHVGALFLAPGVYAVRVAALLRTPLP